MGVTSNGGADSVITMTTTRRDETERVLGVDACLAWARFGWSSRSGTKPPRV